MSASPKTIAEFRVPDDLTELDQWVMWRAEIRGGSRTKVPCRISGERASTTDPSTWASYEQVTSAYAAAEPDHFAGIGFVFTSNDPFTGIDLDDCLQAGHLKPWAEPFVRLFADSYIEVSPSGAGLKLWVKAKLPGSGTKVIVDTTGNVLRDAKNPATDARVDGGIEMYDQSRFFTVTGRSFNGALLHIEDHQADVVALYQKVKGFAVVGKPKADIAEQTAIVEGGRHDHLTSMAAQFGAKGMGFAEILAATEAINQSRCKPPKSQAEVRAICEWVVNREQARGPKLSRSMAPRRNSASDSPDLKSFLHNDYGNSERIVAMFGSDLRYCHPLKRWLFWDGHRWAVDTSEQSRRLAKETILEYLRQAIAADLDVDIKFAKSSLDSKRITNALREAQHQIFVQPVELDQHPFLLNFRNGTVDLRTSILSEHRREDFITKLVRHRYVTSAECALWLKFLIQLMGGGPGASEGEVDRARRLVAYLRRALGYSLTGTTIEKAVFIPFGSGDNGKSTMLSTFRNLVEEYSHLLQVDTLMVRQESNNTQADLADLRGARFVQTSETEEGQRLAQGKLKRITQGMGKIKATRKYENPIEFNETHKLWIDTNRKPTIRDVDDKATFNRLHPIPFTVTIPKDQIDKELPDKLLTESEGILAWAVEGARLWYASGLGKPAEVEAAKDKWREDMDQLGRFMDERCVTGDAFRAGASALYADYKQWATDGGDRSILTSTTFGTKLTDRGFAKRHLERGVVYIGIGLRADDQQPPR